MTRRTLLNPYATAGDAVSKLGGNGKPGIYVPDGWGASWQAKLAAAKAGTGLAKISVRGDSVSQGYYASNLVTKPYAGLLSASLQTLYGDGGSGFDGAARSNQFLTGQAQNSNVITAWTTAGSLYTLTGTWTTNVGSMWGPGSVMLQSVTSGATLTRTFRGTTLKIYWIGTGAGTNSAWTYTIDGGSGTTIPDTTTGPFGVIATTITGLSAGTHTLVITKAADTTNFQFFGIEGSNAAGVRVDNFGKQGAAGWTDFPASLNAGSSTRASGLWSGGSANASDLLIYSFGLNESWRTVASGVTLSASVSNLATSFTMSGYLPPGTYRIDSDTVYIRSVTGAAAPYTATMAATRPINAAHSSGAAINIPEISVDAYLYNMWESITDLRETNPDAEILILMQHGGTISSLRQFQFLAGAARGAAEQFGAALVDMWALGRNSWNYWNTLGYWGNGNTTTPGISGTDGVHLSDTGHQKVHDTILPLLKGLRVP